MNTVKQKNFERRFLDLQRDIFRAERNKRKAITELTRITSAGFVAAVEALATTPRQDCAECGLDYGIYELGESGACRECYETKQERRNNQ